MKQRYRRWAAHRVGYAARHLAGGGRRSRRAARLVVYCGWRAAVRASGLSAAEIDKTVGWLAAGAALARSRRARDGLSRAACAALGLRGRGGDAGERPGAVSRALVSGSFFSAAVTCEASRADSLLAGWA